MEIILVFSFILSLFDGKSLDQLIIFLRSLSIILHIPLTRILVPSNVNMVFSIIIPIVMFDILETEWTSGLLLSFDYGE